MLLTLLVSKWVISKDFKELQLSNKAYILLTDLVSKFLKSKEVNTLHLLNKPDISITFEVLKLLTSKVVKTKQLAKAEAISVTWEVSKLLIFIHFKDSQPLNIWFIFVKEGVWKFAKSKYSNFLQLSNILCIVMADVVTKFDRFKLVKPWQL